MNAPDAIDERPSTQKLTIIYDERCAVCRRARDWLLTQPCLIEVELMPAGSVEATERYGELPWLGSELIAVDDQGRAWVGPAAFIAAMWATRKYRPWAYRLSRPHLAPHAERFFHWISVKRDQWSVWLGRTEDLDCSWCGPARASGYER